MLESRVAITINNTSGYTLRRVNLWNRRNRSLWNREGSSPPPETIEADGSVTAALNHDWSSGVVYIALDNTTKLPQAFVSMAFLNHWMIPNRAEGSRSHEGGNGYARMISAGLQTYTSGTPLTLTYRIGQNNSASWKNKNATSPPYKLPCKYHLSAFGRAWERYEQMANARFNVTRQIMWHPAVDIRNDRNTEITYTRVIQSGIVHSSNESSRYAAEQGLDVTVRYSPNNLNLAAGLESEVRLHMNASQGHELQLTEKLEVREEETIEMPIAPQSRAVVWKPCISVERGHLRANLFLSRTIINDGKNPNLSLVEVNIQAEANGPGM